MQEAWLMSSLSWRNIKILGSLSNQNNVVSRMSQVCIVSLHEQFSFLHILQLFSSFPWDRMTCFAVVWTKISRALSLPTQTYFWWSFLSLEKQPHYFLGGEKYRKCYSEQRNDHQKYVCICSLQSTQTIIILLSLINSRIVYNLE